MAAVRIQSFIRGELVRRELKDKRDLMRKIKKKREAEERKKRKKEENR